VTRTYTYDDAGRITSVSDGTTMITYTWDASTNLVRRTVPEPTSGALLAAAVTTLAMLRRRRIHS
jgi:YD repeat-containing protein